ncbi:MATE family efflux transporter [Mangrovicoccus algicola]|uniref:Multidrug-efflux transporter n=1 Tax=Mangrovicoccus algicola TaxID=2771008 RepID=A0A8J6YYQ7_9RHOB|nr:MATE family efflux transporter [Mangrovicoccus algicola]MBE3640090.1 MATE family efflux transporter [Mangrovicoccus algicola]
MVQFASLRPHVRPLLLLGLPLVGGQIAQVAIQIIDTLMLGRYDTEVLAAVVLATSLFFTVFIVGAGFSWAVTPLVAAASAAGDPVRVRRVTRMGFWASMGYGVLVLPVFLLSEPLFLALGQSPELARIAARYLDVAGWGIFPALAVMTLRAYLAGQARAQVVMWVTVAATVLNAGLNWLLIFGSWGFPEWGGRGAATASVLANSASVAVLAIYAERSFPGHQLFVRLWKPDWAELRQVFQLGWPIGVATLAETALFSAAAVMVGWLGVAELAAHGIALQLATVTFMMHLGLSQAATVLIGQAHGRGDRAAKRGISLAALVVSLGVAAVTIAVLAAIPRPLIRLFVDPADPMRDAILATGVGLVYMAAIFQLADGAQVVAISLLRGLQDTRVPMWQAAFSYWAVGAPLGWVLGIAAGAGAVGVWAGLAGGLCCAAVLLWRRLWRVQLAG